MVSATAKRPNETDCIAYTLSKSVAIAWANKRSVDVIHQYTVKKGNVLALFLRRNEKEIIVLNQSDVNLTSIVAVTG